MTRGIIKAVSCRGPAFFDGIDEIAPAGATQPVAASRADAARRATREIIGVSRLNINHHARWQRRDSETGRFI